MPITVYGLAFSTFTCTVLMTCIEKGAPYELDESGLSPISALGKRPHIDRHPFGRIPVIRDGDFMLYETSAICRYIDEKFDGPSLIPTSLHERALMEKWISVINSYVDESVIRRFVLHYAFPRGENGRPDRDVIDGEISSIRRCLRILDEGYGKTGYVVGNALTLADLFIAPILYYLSRTREGPDLLKDALNVQRGLEVISTRASFGKNFKTVRQNEAVS